MRITDEALFQCPFLLMADAGTASLSDAEVIGLRYNVANRIEGYNISQGRAVSIAIFRSEGTE